MPGLIGLYGGSFDPVHRGHVETARELQARLPFEDLRFLPAARSPLKDQASEAAAREAMLALALRGHPGLTVDARELHRPPPSYTIDTLRGLRSELGKGMSLAFILGLDSLLDLPRWREWRQLTDFAHLLVVSRPGFMPNFAPELADWLKNVRTDDSTLLQSRPRGAVLFVETAPWPVASRDLRAAIARGEDVSDFLDPAVRDYIEEHQLYRQNGDTHAQ